MSVTEILRNELKRLLSQCNEKQVQLFNRMYKSVEVIPKEKMEWAIEQCERTLIENAKKKL